VRRALDRLEEERESCLGEIVKSLPAVQVLLAMFYMTYSSKICQILPTKEGNIPVGIETSLILLQA